MNPQLGWALAAAALGAGWFSYGWAGVALAVSIIVFWLLLQFSRVMRVMQRAGARPVGHVDSAVMLHARMARGLRLIDILPMAGSLGMRVGDEPEAFEWADASGAALRVELEDGRCTGWTLRRPDEPAPAEAAATEAAPPKQT
ncbi:MAG: hypothetical protein ACKVQR_15680 [Aquabacterium sp.]